VFFYCGGGGPETQKRKNAKTKKPKNAKTQKRKNAKTQKRKKRKTKNQKSKTFFFLYAGQGGVCKRGVRIWCTLLLEAQSGQVCEEEEEEADADADADADGVG
jgi:hypothetical protein